MSQSAEITKLLMESIALYMRYGHVDPNNISEAINYADLPGFRGTDTMILNASVNFFTGSGTGVIYSPDTSMESWNILFERYAVPFTELEDRKDIRFARIAFYEDAETTTETVNDKRAHLSSQIYGLDISVIRAYMKDNATRGEIPLMNIRDKIVDWARTINVQFVSGNYLYTLTYTGASPIFRNDKFVSRTLTFTAIRDLYKEQNLPQPEPPMPPEISYITDDDGEFLTDNLGILLTE
jgi:hypothetical protein